VELFRAENDLTQSDMAMLLKSGTVPQNRQAFRLHGHRYTLYFLCLFWAHVFLAFQHNLGTFCLCKWSTLSLNFDALKLNWVIDIVIYT
jgi:hypothetical protein